VEAGAEGGEGDERSLGGEPRLARLVEGEIEPAAAVEELIRWDPPLQLFERWVLEAGVELAGEAVPRGEKVALLFGSANRDPRVFAEPDAFDVGRANASDHIGFGGGIHVCIGAALARIELAAALATLVERAPGLTLAAQPRRNRAFVIWGLEGLEVKVRD
jgi:unspecific monooxygenase